ncbi:hypothetical protein FQA47_015852 [Oryzias melastigma]|uniref:Uncharacterized protein n=1 Tax=Oryzias melastigma TaxID=30732 RepID=A0A834CB85_ORYME|nr:hypothetical protein FQA47_015852 [Oryzias melastigma]
MQRLMVELKPSVFFALPTASCQPNSNIHYLIEASIYYRFLFTYFSPQNSVDQTCKTIKLSFPALQHSSVFLTKTQEVRQKKRRHFFLNEDHLQHSEDLKKKKI